jgi:hypothetical protein
MIMKKIKIFAILICATALYSAEPIVCEISSQTEHQPIGDETGKSITTIQSVYRDCSQEVKVKGPCEEWDESKQETPLPDRPTVAQEYDEFDTQLAEVLGYFDAVNRMNQMFSGTRGVCEKGLTYNFDWLEDPSFWASMVTSAMGSGVFGDGVQELMTGYSGCLMGGSIDIAGEGVNYMIDNVERCDPVDEFCEEEGETQADPGDVVSLTVAEYNALLIKEPDIVKAIEIIDNGASSGYVVFRYLSYDEMSEIEGLSEEEADKVREDAKMLRLKIKGAVTGVQILACVGGNALEMSEAPVVGGGGVLDGNAVDAVVSGAMGMLPFPYGAAAQAAWKMLNSFSDIDSCHDEGDAQSQGKRHEIAYRSLRNEFQTCHKLYDECVFNDPVGDTCRRRQYHYCCYANPFSMHLMVQLHAQMGHDWEHCTGISLNEFAHVNWKQCSESQMSVTSNGGFMDGAEMRGYPSDYDMTRSYQYKYQCMNLKPIVSYIQSQIPDEFDGSKAMDMIRDLDPDMLE